jgi:hypothetical protein
MTRALGDSSQAPKPCLCDSWLLNLALPAQDVCVRSTLDPALDSLRVRVPSGDGCAAP